MYGGNYLNTASLRHTCIESCISVACLWLNHAILVRILYFTEFQQTMYTGLA